MWELDHKEGWALKNWCFQIVVLEKTIDSPLDCKEIKPANPKGNQPWIFIGRTNAEALILWPPNAKSWLIGKDLDAGKDWGQEKGMTEDEMVGWHHQLNGPEFQQALGDSEGPGSLACCSSWGHKESDVDQWLKNKTVAHQAPLSMDFPRQEYWSRLPFPSPGDLPDPGIGPTSPILQADSLPLSHGLP